MTEVDYLIVGAGAMGLAFADTILTETDATIAIVDRYGRPGGHWNRAYPFVRLHQPSSFYGVNSRPLGSGLIDTIGGNAGLFELASGAEVLAYFDQLMNQQFLPSGRVHYFPASDCCQDGTVVSLTSGVARPISAKKVVDSTYMQVAVPSMRPAPYAVAPGVKCIPPNGLMTLDGAPSRYFVVGAGKTGMDTCLWLLGTGVDPDRITWIMPRDSWVLDRKRIQPGPQFVEAAGAGMATQLESLALATSVDDLFERLEEGGQLLRLDQSVRPTMYKCATVTEIELETLRRIKNVVRLGHVQSVTETEVVLDQGSISTDAGALYIDCSADGLSRQPAVPVFNGDRITLQSVRTCQQVFSAAFIGHIEVAISDDAKKNELCTPVPHPDTDIDWLRTTLANMANQARWAAEPGLGAWLGASRLNIQIGLAGPPTPEQMEVIMRITKHREGAVSNLQRLLAEAEAAAAREETPA